MEEAENQKASFEEKLSDDQRARVDETEEIEEPPVKKLDTLVDYDCETIEEIIQQVEQFTESEKKALEKIVDINSQDLLTHGAKGGLKFILNHGLITPEYLESISADPNYHEIAALRKKSGYTGGSENYICFGHRGSGYYKNTDHPDVYSDLSKGTVPFYPEQIIIGRFHILGSPVLLGEFLQADPYGSDGYRTIEGINQIKPELFSGIRIPDPIFHPLALPMFPEFENYPEIKERILKLNEILSKYDLEDFHSGLFDYGECIELRREINRSIIADPHLKPFLERSFSFWKYDNPLPRYDNYRLAQKSIDLYAQMQKSLQEEGKGGIPLYSDNGDMLWPLKLPYGLVKEYSDQYASSDK